jgi:hypothetical protein
VLAIVLSGCGIGPGRPSPVPPPTLAEALDHLASAEAVVRSGDLSHFCDTFGSGTCSMELRDADTAVPKTDPAVIGTGVIPPETFADGTWSDGGRVLRICGRDGLNNPYYSEILVFSGDGGRMISIGTVFWIGTRIATDRVTEASPASPPPCPT